MTEKQAKEFLRLWKKLDYDQLALLAAQSLLRMVNEIGYPEK